MKEKRFKMQFNNDYEIKKFWNEGQRLYTNDEAIEKSIERAARDFTARTETRVSFSGDSTLSKRLQNTNNNKNLKKILKNYFNNPSTTQDDFNAWHHTTCQSILDIVNDMYQNVHYGKAQKILNMTFKNLYCTAFGQSKEKENQNTFKFCHIALDSFTLEWIFREIYPCYKKLECDRLCKTKTPSWSNLDYDAEDKKVYSYSFIVNIVAKYFKTFHKELNDLTPFKAEFIIWREIQLEMAAETFYKQAYSYLNEDSQKFKMSEFKDLSLQDKLNQIRDLMGNNL